MRQVLGRVEHQPWATKWPVSSLGATLIAAVVGIGIFTYCNIEMWTPLQQWYWVQYLNTKSFPTARGDYQLLTTVDAHGKQLMAVDADVHLAQLPRQTLLPFPGWIRTACGGQPAIKFLLESKLDLRAGGPPRPRRSDRAVPVE